MKRHWLVALPFLFLGILAVWLRFWHISSIPFSLYHDEMDYVATGEAVARFGTDISGQWNPLQLAPLKTLNVTAELPAIFHAGAQLIFGFGPQSAHIPAALFGLATVLLITLLTYLLSKNRLLAILVGLSLSINPWHVYISRLGYEAVISIFFQLVFITGLWLSLKAQKRKQVVISMILMLVGIFFAFFTYHAAKFSIPLFVLAGFAWLWKAQVKKLNYKLLAVGLVFFTGALLLFIQLSPGRDLLAARESDLLFSSDFLSSQVDEERRIALDYSGIPNTLFINKPILFFQALTNHYLSVFDFYRLFVSGYEGGFQFSLAVHGFFYLSSIPLIVFGIKWWAKEHRTSLFFILTFILLAPIASTITVSYQSIFRSGITYLLLSVLSGAGVYSILKSLQKWRYSQVIILLFGALLIAEAVWFGSRYFTRYPLVSAENHYFFERALAGYTHRVSGKKLIVVQSDPYSPARSIIFYNQLLPTLTSAERLQFAAPKAETYVFGDTTVTNLCPEHFPDDSTTLIIDSAMLQDCKYATKYTTDKMRKYGIGSPTDSRMYYYLLHDRICLEQQLPDFIYNSDLTAYQFDTLQDQDFCRLWVQEE